ncbi:MAG TPA: cation:proton antiporter [Candidatus Lustribacter sp.]|nr:cation:proton antiporter [Candidatus Lustribacter sp.]
MTGVAGTTAILVGLLGVAVLVALAAERLRVPAAVALVAFGAGTAAIYPVALPFHFGDTLLFIFLPPLIFEAAWSIDPAALRRSAARIALLALPGVVLVAGTIGFGIALSGQLPLAPAIVLGAIVSTTDPVAVIAIFRRMHVPIDLLTIVEGESIANDGAAIVLYGVALTFAAGGVQDSVALASLHAALAIAGGCAIGVACAAVVAFVMGRTRSGPLEITATVVLAFLAYLSADALHCSGVFSTAAAGIALRAFAHIGPVTDHADDVDTFWSTIAFIVNALVFLATGLVLQIGRIASHPLLVVVAILAVVISRVLLAALIIRPMSWRVTVVLAGMRGGLSLALALALPQTLPYREPIVDAVFGVVLFTLIVQGVALEPVLQRLGFQSGSGGPSLSS